MNNVSTVNSIEISTVNETLVVDSRLIADELGIEHESFMRTIKKYESKLEQRFGILRFEIGTSQPNTNGAVHQVKFAWLTEDQATALMTFSRNTDQVVECKLNLVEAFSKAKQLIKSVIPQQSERIQELELQLAIATQNNQANQATLSARQLDNTMLTMHGKETVLALRGMADQIIETEKPTIEIIDERHNVTFKGQTLVQIKDFIAKKHGIKFKSGAAIKQILEKKGEGHLIAQTLRSVSSDYVPDENLKAVYKLLCSDQRQMLIGE